MARRVFYSFHYKADCHRAAQVRNMGAVEGTRPASDNDWEAVTKGGAAAIERWIDRQLFGKSCAVVLIGSNTAGRKWINYEIREAWSQGLGLVGIYVHKLRNLAGLQTQRGENPFGYVALNDARRTQLSSIVKVHNPPFYLGSRSAYAHIKKNLPRWIEEAIDIRDRHD